MTIKKVGVVGAGVMGSGLAMDLLLHEIPVIMYDISEKQLENFSQTFRNNFRFQLMFKPELKGLNADKIFGLYTGTCDIESLKDVDIVIENVIEKWEVKRDLWIELDKICLPHSVFVSNTSAIPITKQASVTVRQDKFVGIHFMNPVPMKEWVELIKGFHTSEETLNITKGFLELIDKKWVEVNDSPGFISNRVLMLTINEAIFLLHEGVASVEDIDLTFKHCFGHKMGPLETADLIGLDTILNSLLVLYESFNDSKFRPCPLLKKLVDAGYFGKKNSKGFYNLNNKSL